MKQLSTQQLLLLNNLMYMNNSGEMLGIDSYEPGITVGEIVNRTLEAGLDPGREYGTYMTGQDWNNMLNAIAKDPQLMNVQLVAQHYDTGAGSGGGFSAVFADPSTGEAVVAFRGTASGEWKDDFLGGTVTGAADGVSTAQQQNALDWYQSLDLDAYSSVTVTGHSKGGNKAKYITVLDDSVTRCVSFDGQGFSDEFIRTYASQIRQNQGKISNNNVDYDYVNLLLNDIGSETFYQGQNYGTGGFLENHCPNTFFGVDEAGNLIMTETERPEEMAALDHYLNTMLRSMPESQRQDTLEIIGNLMQEGFSEDGNWPSALSNLATWRNADEIYSVLAFTIAYEYVNPKFPEQIRSVLNRFGMEDAGNVVNWGTILLNLGITVRIPSAFGGAMMIMHLLPDELREKVEQWIPILNTDSVFSFTGQDLRINSGITGLARFSVSDTALMQAAEQLNSSAAAIRAISEELSGISAQFTGMLELLLRASVSLRANSLATRSTRCAALADNLNEIAFCYARTEQSVMGQFE